MKKRIALSLISMVSLAVLTACGTGANGTNNAGDTSAAQGGNLLEQIKQRGSIKIGTEGTYAPFSFHDSQNQLTGFDVELARAVAQQLGVKADFVETPWDGMLAGLNDKRFDMVANEVGVTPERQKIYDFSTPYITSASVLIVRKDNTTIHSFKDLKGKKSAQTLTSNFGKMAQENGATIVSVQGFNEALQLVESGRVDATINDKLSFLAFMKQHPDAPLKVVATNQDASKSAFAFRKGNPELVKAVDDALATLEKNGTYDKISKKWFNENVLH
jgi:cystine transport system substrate-binding protein